MKFFQKYCIQWILNFFFNILSWTVYVYTPKEGLQILQAT